MRSFAKAVWRALARHSTVTFTVEGENAQALLSTDPAGVREIELYVSDPREWKRMAFALSCGDEVTLTTAGASFTAVVSEIVPVRQAVMVVV